jgi:hypothetical protein
MNDALLTDVLIGSTVRAPFSAAATRRISGTELEDYFEHQCGGFERLPGN